MLYSGLEIKRRSSINVQQQQQIGGGISPARNMDRLSILVTYRSHLSSFYFLSPTAVRQFTR